MTRRRAILSTIGLLMIAGAVGVGFLPRLTGDPEHPIDYGSAVLDLATIASLETRSGETEEQEFQSTFTLTYPREMKENQTSVVTLGVDAYLLKTRPDPTSPGAKLVDRITDLEFDENSGIALNSSGFEIAPDGVINKPPGTEFPTDYKWTITPKREGNHSLVLNFSGYVGALEENERVQSKLLINDGPILMKNDNVELDVVVNTKWGVSALVVSLVQAVVGVLGFVLVYPIVAEKIGTLIRGRAKTTTQREAQAPSIFISYRREDDPYAARGINDALCSAFGKQNVYFDLDAMQAGLDYRTQIEQQVDDCDVMLVIIGDNWHLTDESGTSRLESKDDWVRLEVSAALGRNIPVIPVLVGRAEVPSEDNVPQQLKSLAYRQAREVRPTADFDSQIKTLIDDIENVAHIAHRQLRYPPPRTDTN